MTNYKKQIFVADGDVVTLELPHSEVCMHMRVAGKVMRVRFQIPHGYPNAQILNADGSEFSAAITTGEAGFYFADGQYYCYPATEVK